MKRSLPATLLFLILTGLSYSQQLKTKDLTRKLDKLISGQYAAISPGAVLLVAQKNKIIYEKAYGKANLELSVPMNPAMVFRIGSITKQFTAIAILQLAEQGKLSLQDSIQQYFEDFPADSGVITIENLLTQTSGIMEYQTMDWHIPNAIRIDFPPAKLVDSLKSESLQFKPGARFSYSNSNYFLLGMIIEKVSGRPYQQYLEQHIFKPLGLSGTFYDDPESVIPNRVSGYTKNDTNFRNAGYISMSSVYAAGALLSNVRDLHKWHAALIAGKLVSIRTLEKAFTPYTLADGKKSEYGYGWFVRDYHSQASIGHGGAIDGFRSMEVYLPDKEMFLVVLLNSDNEDYLKLFEDMLSIVAGITTPPHKDLKLADSILNRYVGTYQYVGADTAIRVTIKIYKEKDRLYADLSNGTGSHMALFPQSETHFVLAIRIPTAIDFIIQNGKVMGLVATQKEQNKFTKIE